MIIPTSKIKSGQWLGLKPVGVDPMNIQQLRNAIYKKSWSELPSPRQSSFTTNSKFNIKQLTLKKI